MEGESGGSEERRHILLVEGELPVSMRESNEDGLGVCVPSHRPFVCVRDDSLRLGRVGHVLGESDSNPFRYFVSLDFINRSGVVGSEDGIEVDSLSCQEGKPLLLGELWALGRVGETTSGCFEVEGVIFNELEGALQLRMEEGSTNLSNRLPWELRLVDT